MDMATDADINIEHRLTEVEQRAKSNTNRLNEHDEILKSNSEMIGAIKELATEVKYMRGDLNETVERLGNPCVLLTRMRIYFHWNVCLFIDRKCDHCGNRRIRYPASDLSLERHPELYPFGSMGKCSGSCGVVDAGRTCSLEYDEKCRDQRGTGADRTGRNTDYLLCKENSV